MASLVMSPKVAHEISSCPEALSLKAFANVNKLVAVSCAIMTPWPGGQSR